MQEFVTNLSEKVFPINMGHLHLEFNDTNNAVQQKLYIQKFCETCFQIGSLILHEKNKQTFFFQTLQILCK